MAWLSRSRREGKVGRGGLSGKHFLRVEQDCHSRKQWFYLVARQKRFHFAFLEIPLPSALRHSSRIWDSLFVSLMRQDRPPAPGGHSPGLAEVRLHIPASLSTDNPTAPVSCIPAGFVAESLSVPGCQSCCHLPTPQSDTRIQGKPPIKNFTSLNMTKQYFPTRR